MPRPPKIIVPVDPEHQPHIKKFVTDPKKIGVSTLATGKTTAKTSLKKRRRRSTGETKLNKEASWLYAELLQFFCVVEEERETRWYML